MGIGLAIYWTTFPLNQYCDHDRIHARSAGGGQAGRCDPLDPMRPLCRLARPDHGLLVNSLALVPHSGNQRGRTDQSEPHPGETP